MAQIKKRPLPPRRHRHGDPIGIVDRGQKKRSSNGLVAAAVGIVFVGYVYNAAGLQTGLNGFFSGLDQGLHRHEGAIGGAYLSALPVFGVLALAFLGFMAHSYLRGVSPRVRKNRRKGVKGAADHIAPATVERVLVRPRAYPGSDAGVAILVDTGSR